MLTRKRILGVLVVCAGLAVSLLVNYHSYLADANLVPGDRGDTRLVVFTLEHWFKVLGGHERFYDLQMFYPAPDALGYADGLFLFGFPYAAFRALGVDPFTSYQLFFVFMTALGYGAWLALLRRSLSLHLGFAVLAAALLTSMNCLQYQAQIGKLTGFNLFPILIGLLLYYVRASDRANWRSTLALGAFAALTSLFLFTSYYPAWFFLFTLCLFAALQLGFLALIKGTAFAVRSAVGAIDKNWRGLLAAIVVFGLALIPFIATYGPLVASKQQRSYRLAMEFAPAIKDVLNVSQENLLWSKPLQAVGFDFGGLEARMGTPPIVLALFLASTAYIAMRVFRRGPPARDAHDRIILLLVATALVILGLTAKVHEVSAWYLVHALVPGASALRAIGRYLIVIDMIVIVTAVYGIDQWFSSIGGRTAVASVGLAAGLGVLSVLLVGEQINLSSFRLDKAEELATLRLYRPPAQDCTAFFASNAASVDLPYGYYQLDAMMISMQLGIPTVNGYSGFEPHRAFTLPTTGSEYNYRIMDWLVSRDALDGICELDMQTRTFRQTDVLAQYAASEDLYLQSIFDRFSALYDAARSFAEDGNDLAELSPQALEEQGYLDRGLGYGAGLRYKWIGDRYWIGERSCGNGSCVGIRVIGTPLEIQRILDTYASLARRVEYPEPMEWSEELSYPRDAEAQLLMLFRFHVPPQ